MNPRSTAGATRLALAIVLTISAAGCSGDETGRDRGTGTQSDPPAAAVTADPDDDRSTRGDDDGGDPGGMEASTAPGAMPVVGERIICPSPTVTVATAEELASALVAAAPGDVIQLAPGTFEGKFVATAQATADDPIHLCGGRDSVIDGEGIKGGYAIHLDGASGWRLVGFSVRNAQKGVVADGAVDNIVEGLLVEDIGDEAIHLRAFSTDNIVRGNEIRDTGQRRDKFGEGVYVGSAESNWCQHSGCEPDRSDRNVIEGNLIYGTTAESVDLKEGSSDGVVRDNSFGGQALSGADSWVDAKGNDWTIEGNTGTGTTQDGFQMHEILDGWGTGNVFRGNVAQVDGPGFGFATTNTEGNVISCDNRVTGAGQGFADTECVA